MMKSNRSLRSSGNILTLEELNKEYETRKKQLKSCINDITKIRKEAKKFFDSLDDEEKKGNLQTEMRNAADFLKQLTLFNKELTSLEKHYLEQRAVIKVNEYTDDDSIEFFE